MLVVHPPDHTRSRRLVSRAFTPRATAAFEPAIQRTADRLLDAPEGRAGTAEVGGRAVRAGTRVTLLLGAANRDPEVFPDPAGLDVTRANAREHLAFSGGIHYCVGAGLARLEGALGLRALTERFPGLRVAGAPQRRDLQTLRGFEVLAMP